MKQLLYKKEIEDIKNSGYLNKDVSVTDALIEAFYNKILKEEEKEILKVTFSDDLKQEDINHLLSKWDIEAKDGHKNLMLAYIMKSHPEMQFTEYEQPRLKGLLKYYRFQNLNVISHYVKIVRALNEAGITPVIVKGGVMKYLRPELPRIMGDIDIIVPEKYFMKSAEIAVSLGYTYNKVDIHSIDIHKDANSENGILDIHRFIYMNTGYERAFIKDLFKRARKENVFGAEVLVPCNEDLVFITLVNLARNLRDKTSQAGLIFSVFDCDWLQKKDDFNWNIIIENARKTHSGIQMNFAIKFIKKISEKIIPDIIQNDMLFEKQVQDYSNCVMFNRFYLEEIREKCRAMKIGKIFSGEYSIKDYITLKPKYFFLKLLRNHPIFIKFFIRDLKTKSYDFEKIGSN